ncbi:MAG: hypothetical protein WC390_11330 [Sulfurimonas sp.]|jgi:hypothetical protein
MATNVWRGGAPAVAQLDTITVAGTWATNDIATITINGHALTFTVGATQTGAAVVTGLVALWAASTLPECLEVTAADGSGDTVTLTAVTAGVPFTVTVSETTAGDGTLSLAVTTANSGPNDWSTASNWSLAAAPVNTNDVIIEWSEYSIYYGLAQSGVTLASLTVKQSFTGTIGLPRINASDYPEYRDTYLAIGATVMTIGGGDGIGSGRIKINNGTVQTAFTLLGSGSTLEDGIGAIVWKGTHASNAVSVTKGDLSVAPFAAEVATVLTLKMGYYDSPDTDAVVTCGSGVTLGTVIKNGGNLTCDNTTTAITAFTQTAGEATIYGMTNAVTALNLYGGRVYYSTAGTLTAGVVMADAVLDFSRDMRAKTVTAIQAYGQNTIFDPAAVVTFTSGIDYMGCDGITGIGKHRTWTPTAI